MSAVAQGFFGVVEHYLKQGNVCVRDVKDRTNDHVQKIMACVGSQSGVLTNTRKFSSMTPTARASSASERIVGIIKSQTYCTHTCAWRWYCAVDVRIDQDRMFFASFSAIRNTNEHVGEIEVGLVSTDSNHVDPANRGSAQYATT